MSLQNPFLSFNIDELSSKYDQNLLSFLESSPNLVTLKLTQYFRITFPKLGETIGNKLMNLQSLDLCGIILSQQEVMDLSNCCTIQHLAIRFDADTEAIGELFKNNQYLKSVHLIDCFRKIQSSCCRFLPSTLKTFKLNACVLTNYLQNDSYLENKVNNFLESLESFALRLEHLCIDVSKCINLETVGVLKLLTNLTLRNQDPITGPLLRLIAENCTMIQKLDLHPIAVSTQHEDIAHLVLLDELNELALEGKGYNNVEQYQKEILRPLQYCENLQVLKVVHLRCEDSTADLIVDHCRNLTRVHLENCLLTTDFITVVLTRLEMNIFRTEDLHLILPDISRGKTPPLFRLEANTTRLHKFLIVDGADPFYDYRQPEKANVQEEHIQNDQSPLSPLLIPTATPPPTPPLTPPASLTPPHYLEFELLDIDNNEEFGSSYEEYGREE